MSDEKRYSWWSKFVMSVPFIRRWMAKNTFGDTSVGHLNATVSKYVCPKICELYSTRTDGSEQVFVSRKFYKDFLFQLFGKAGSGYADCIKFEWAHLKDSGNLKIALLTLPHDDAVGQAAHIGFVIDTDTRKSQCFCMEISLNGRFCVCEWAGGIHFNNGTVASKADFVRTIYSISRT